MTRPRADSSTHPPGPSGYRAPTDPRRVLAERRAPMVVDAMRTPPGRRAMTVDLLSPAQRAQFDAQMLAYQAGCALAAACTTKAVYGVPYSHELIDRWHEAVSAWIALRRNPSARLQRRS